MDGLLTILFLTIFVVLHEFGHFVAARISGIAVSEFFVGFGPKLFSFKSRNTEYGVKAFPLGGYVKIPGMDESEDIKGFENDELFHTAQWKTKLFISETLLSFSHLNVPLNSAGKKLTILFFV